MKHIFAPVLLMFLLRTLAVSQADSAGFNLQPDSALTSVVIQQLSYKNTDLRDVVRLIAKKYSLNIFMDNSIQERVSLELTKVNAWNVLEYLSREYRLNIKKIGNIYKITRIPVIPTTPPPPPPLDITYKNGKLTLQVANADLDRVVYKITDLTGQNILLDKYSHGTVSGKLVNVDVQEGLRFFLENNGYHLKKKDDFLMVYRDEFHEADGIKQSPVNRSARLWVDWQDSLLTIESQNSNLQDILHEIFYRTGYDNVMYSKIDGTISLKVNQVPISKALDILFTNTQYTYRQSNDVFYVGKKDLKGMTSQKLITFNYLKIDGIRSLLPRRLQEGLQIQEVKEHNAIIAIGPQDMIRELEEFRNTIDYPVAQILLEVLVVDFNMGDKKELSLEAFRSPTGKQNITSDSTSKTFDTFIPGLDILLSGKNINKYYHEIGNFFGFKNIGKLPSDFNVRLNALQEKDIANVRSRPQLATLNGNTATMNIGFTQYYKLNSNTQWPYPNTNNQQGQNQNPYNSNNYYNPYTTTERFQTVEATISLEITPWVSANKEITVQVHPNFQTPVGKLSADVPPTIQKREIQSTVRLKDGETIILGGLIETRQEEGISQLPILGDIPLLGALFRHKNHNKSKQELIIYITPHLYYGTEKAGGNSK